MKIAFLLIATMPAQFLLYCNQDDANRLRIVQAKSLMPYEDRLDKIFNRYVDSAGVPGITVAITRNDSVIYAKGFGVKNLESKEAVTPFNIFHMASVSKPFMATAIVQLSETGKIDLDEKLITYLPYFRMADDHYKEITIRQMLNHTSGFPDVKDYEWEKPQLDEGAPGRYARSLGNEKLVSAPGAEFHYSNMAFDVLADVVAKTSGKSFEAYVKENILKPLQMKESSFFQPETKVALRTTPHTGNPPKVSTTYPYNRRHAPSSTLNSSAVDMCHWAIANLYGGMFKGVRILKPESHALLMTPTFVINKAENVSVGLSWFLSVYKNYSLIAHSGGDLGYRSQLTLVPQKKMGLVIIANWDEAPMRQINDEVLDILIQSRL